MRVCSLILPARTKKYRLPKMMGEEFKKGNEAIKQVTDLEWLTERAPVYAILLNEVAFKQEIPTLFIGMKEAEAVMLFAISTLHSV